MRRSLLLRSTVLPLSLSLWAVPLRAQAPAAPPRRWTGGVQANGSLLFGNAEQRVVGSRATSSHADSLLEVDGALQLLYGDATTEARYAMTRALDASLSLLVNHDSEATRRGARVRTDGQLLFGLGASW